MDFARLYQAIAGWRQGGSTRVSYEAASRYGGLFVVATLNEKRQAAHEHSRDVITLQEIEHGALTGRTRSGPIIIDHFAVCRILSEAHEVFAQLKDEKAWRENLLSGMKEIITIISFEGKMGEVSEIRTWTDVGGAVRAVKAMFKDREAQRMARQVAEKERDTMKAALQEIVDSYNGVGDNLDAKTRVLVGSKQIALKALGIEMTGPEEKKGAAGNAT